MTSKPDEWMPLHVRKYLGDTTHLTRDQHGAYLLLLMAYWMRGAPLPDDNGRLAAICKATGAEWKRLRPVLAEFFIVADGVWAQKRADEELATAKAIMAAKSEAGKAGAAARWHKDASANGKGMATASSSHRQTDAPIPLPSPVFEHSVQTISPAASPKPPADLGPVFIGLPTNRFESQGEEFPVYEPFVEEMQGLFPAVDVRDQLRAMRAWLVTHDQNRKTRTGMKRFINGWLSRQQNNSPRETIRGNGNGHRAKPPSAHDKHNAGAALFIASLGGDHEQRGQGTLDSDADGVVVPLLAS